MSELSEQTLAEVAVRQANMRSGFMSKALYTGRILIKRDFEDVVLPSPIDPVEVSQYLTPELKPWIRPLFRLVINSSDHVPLNRAMVIHSMAEDQPDAISVYDKAGKVEL